MAPRVGTVILAADPSPNDGMPYERDRDGESLVSRLAVAAIASRSAEVALVTGARRREVEAEIVGSGVTCLHNACFHEGLASSLRIAACWGIRTPCEALLLLTLDQPLVSGAHIDKLVDAFELHQGRVASYFGRSAALPAVFPRSDFGALLSARGDERTCGWLDDEDVWLVPFAGGRVRPEPEDTVPPWLREAELDDLDGRAKRPSGVHTIGAAHLVDTSMARPLRLRRA